MVGTRLDVNVAGMPCCRRTDDLIDDADGTLARVLVFLLFLGIRRQGVNKTLDQAVRDRLIPEFPNLALDLGGGGDHDGDRATQPHPQFVGTHHIHGVGHGHHVPASGFTHRYGDQPLGDLGRDGAPDARIDRDAIEIQQAQVMHLGQR